MPRVVHFEFRAAEPDRAIKFYQQVFGWKVSKWEGPMDYWNVSTGEGDEPGIDGAIAPATGDQKVVNTISVDSVDAYLEKVVAAGGKIVMPKTTIPGIGYFAQCADTEGVVFGLMRDDPSAGS
jgi:predicted enzyme related to lactoylglutathione lyase